MLLRRRSEHAIDPSWPARPKHRPGCPTPADRFLPRSRARPCLIPLTISDSSRPVSTTKDGQIANTHVQSDSAAYQIAQQFLTGIGAANQRTLVAFCAVMMIARWTNIQVNHVKIGEAEGYSGSDYQQMTGFLARLPLNRLQQTWFVQQGEAEAKRIIGLPGYHDALDAVAARLIQALEIRDFEVAQLTEQTVGHQLRSAAREPHHNEVSLAAYSYHLDRIRNGQADDSLEDWLVADRGIRFGIASLTWGTAIKLLAPEPRAERVLKSTSIAVPGDRGVNHR